MRDRDYLSAFESLQRQLDSAFGLPLAFLQAPIVPRALRSRPEKKPSHQRRAKAKAARRQNNKRKRSK